jgi:eukaryotic-like serine/threonine-protein kinase
VKNTVVSQSKKNQTDSQSDKDIFFDALDISAPEDRGAFLDQVCAGDLEKRRRLDQLIANHFEQGAFMQSSASRESRDPAAPFDDDSGKVIGHYKLLEKIGEGGFGVVYVAEQRAPVKRRVALKIIKLGMDTRQVVARFEAERQALAMMDHPNIAKVFDAGATEIGRPYFVMELVRGVRITDYCAAHELPVVDRLKLFIQVCQAIQHAHQKGIIHRDIKPSNVIVAVHDGVPVPKVIDFGIAKAVEGDLTDKTIYTQFHQFIGTPAYMSPEQAEMSGLDVDTRTDIYALGVLLYELLTGHTPFDGKELLQSGLEHMRKTIREKEPVRPSTRLRQTIASAKPSLAPRPSLLATDLDWIAMKCLEKDRTRRYPTANDLASDLTRHLNNEVVSAAAPTATYRLRKFYRRHKAGALIGGFFAVLVFAAVVAGIALTLRAREAERVAERNLYIGNVQMMQQAWEHGNIARARDLLEETRSYPGRGFEWFYWNHQLHSGRELRGHNGPVNSVAFSSDGSRLVTGGADGTARVWDTTSGAELLVLNAHSAPVTSASLSPDGRRILTSALGGGVRIWDIETGKRLLGVEQTGPAAFSRDGTKILAQAATAHGHQVIILDAETGREILTLPGHKLGITGAVWSSDGNQVASSSYDERIGIWDASTGEAIFTTNSLHGYFRSVALSPDGDLVAATANSGLARIWRISRREEAFQFEIASSIACPIEFSSDGRLIASLVSEHVVTVRQGSTGAERFSVKSPSVIRSLAFSPDGRQLAAAHEDGCARLWDISADGASLHARVVRPNGAFVYGAAFSPDGEGIITAGSDGVARLWDSESGAQIGSFEGHKYELSAASFFPDGARVVTAGADTTARVWDVRGRTTVAVFRGHRAPVFHARVFPDGRRIVTSSPDGVTKVWEASTGRDLVSLSGNTVAISQDGRRIATAQFDTKVWDAATGHELLNFKGAGAVAFSPDGARIITGGNSEKGEFIATIWDAKNGRRLVRLRGHTAAINSIDVSRDGRRILTASSDRTARLWDAESGKELLLLQGHTGPVSAAVFSPDGRRIATGSHDLTLRIWKTSASAPVTERPPRDFVFPATGFTLQWDGRDGDYYSASADAGPPENDALASKGALAIGSSELALKDLHYIRHINDGRYGNNNSWISASGLGSGPDIAPWIGVVFPKPIAVRAIAWGRDNGNDSEIQITDIATGASTVRKQFTDRALGAYTIQVTRVGNPSQETRETGDAATGWQTIGVVQYPPSQEDLEFSPWLRHQFNIAENDQPVLATAVRIALSNPSICIDELEVNPPDQR